MVTVITDVGTEKQTNTNMINKLKYIKNLFQYCIDNNYSLRYSHYSEHVIPTPETMLMLYHDRGEIRFRGPNGISKKADSCFTDGDQLMRGWRIPERLDLDPDTLHNICLNYNNSQKPKSEEDYYRWLSES